MGSSTQTSSDIDISFYEIFTVHPLTQGINWLN